MCIWYIFTLCIHIYNIQASLFPHASWSKKLLHGFVQPPALTLGKWLKRSLKKCGSGIRIMSFSVFMCCQFAPERNKIKKPRIQPKPESTRNTLGFSNIYSWFIPFAKLDQPSQVHSSWVSDIPKRCTRQLIYKIFEDSRIIAPWHGGSNLGFVAKALKQMRRFKVDLELGCLEGNLV